MPLSLTLTNARQWSPGTPGTRVLASGRLTIGRSASNDWVLPDPERVISKHHGVIEGAGETFRLFDSSVNGVFINESDQPVGANNVYILRHGDHIRIGGYEINAAIEAHAGRSAEAHAGRSARPQDPVFDEPLTSAADLFERPSDSGRLLEDDSLFPIAPKGEGKQHQFADLDRGSPADEAFAPPRAIPEVPPASLAPASSTIPDAWDLSAPEPAARSDKADSKGIPTEWDPFALDDGKNEPAVAEPVHSAPPLPEDQAPAKAPDLDSATRTPSPPDATAGPQPGPGLAGQDRLVKAFLAGAGVGPTSAVTQNEDAERMMREVGEIFRIVVAGMIAVLDSRRALKREVGVASTEFRLAENNSLNFTLGVEDTVRILLAGGERGYLPPAQAFEEAFADIKQHQVAVLAGMQEAWMDLLRRLDPKALERRLSDDAGLSGLLSSRKARCWDAYRQLYETIAGDAETDYKNLFSRAFSHAYEKHLSAASK